MSEDIPPIVALAAIKAGCRPGELLGWKVYPGKVVIVPPSGVKRSWMVEELELPGNEAIGQLSDKGEGDKAERRKTASRAADKKY